MTSEAPAPTDPFDVPQSQIDEWQSIVDLMARVVGVPAGLVMRVTGEDIEVYVSSATDGNPYKPGDREKVWGSGLYCETVIKQGDGLHVPNALADEDWKSNPDTKLGMISYLGFPITFPDGRPFGTLCVLDSSEHAYTEDQQVLLRKLRDLVQSHLALLYMNQALHGENLRLIDYVEEIKTLRGIIPICAWCKKIRDRDQYWHELEDYISSHSEAVFSHALCPTCAKDVFPDATGK